MAWELEGRKEEAWPLGMLKSSWRILLNTWWVLSKTRVSKHSSNPTQPPAKLKTKQKGKTQSVAMDCAF
jgi:hypothetical protein